MWADAKKVGFKDIGTPELDLLIFTPAQRHRVDWGGIRKKGQLQLPLELELVPPKTANLWWSSIYDLELDGLLNTIDWHWSSQCSGGHIYMSGWKGVGQDSSLREMGLKGVG